MDGTLDTVAYSDVSPSSVFARVIYVSSNITFCRTISCLSVVHCVLPLVASSSSTPVVNPSTCDHTVFYLSCFRLRMSRIYLSGNKHIHILIMILDPGSARPDFSTAACSVDEAPHCPHGAFKLFGCTFPIAFSMPLISRIPWV